MGIAVAKLASHARIGGCSWDGPQTLDTVRVKGETVSPADVSYVMVSRRVVFEGSVVSVGRAKR